MQDGVKITNTKAKADNAKAEDEIREDETLKDEILVVRYDFFTV